MKSMYLDIVSMDRLSNKLEMEDENTIELMIKSEKIVHNIE